MLLYETYYKRRVSFQLGKLADPRKNPIQTLEIPKGVALHYVGESVVQYGPAEDLFVYRFVPDPIQMVSLFEYDPTIQRRGNPTRLAVNLQIEFGKYIRSHRKYRRLLDPSRIRSIPHIQLIYNYCNIDKAYRYIENKYSHYNAWYNKFATVVKSMDKACIDTGRQQFLILSMPEVLPSATHLLKAEQQVGMPLNILPHFPSSESRIIAELWTWLSKNRINSLFNEIKPENYNKINIIFQDSGRWVAYRLDDLNKWRLTPKEEIEILNVSNPNLKGLDPDLLKRMFLRGLMTLLKSRSSSALSDDEIDQEQSVVDDEEDDDDTLVQIKDKVGNVVIARAADTIHLEQGAKEKEEQTILNKVIALEKELERAKKDSDFTSVVNGLDISELEELIDQDLFTLDKINENIDKQKTIKDNEPGLPGTDELSDSNKTIPTTYEDAFMKICQEYSEAGLLTSNEYNRFLKQSEAYKSITMPNGQTLEQFIQVSPEQLKIDWKKPKPSIDTVEDESLIGSTLKEFNSKYNTEILHKDVAKMVLNLQYGGIAVTNFQVRRQESILGASYIYEIRLSPIDGEAGTIRFTIPEVDKNGIFRINGVKYRFRNQQAVHLPIKKTSPSQVSLTSYYGKLFIDRTERKANDYGNWITKTIKLAALEGSETIFGVESVPTFVPTHKAPRVFTVLSKVFSGFKVKLSDSISTVLDLSFDLRKLELEVGTERYQSFINDGMQPCGFSNGNVIVIDNEDKFYLITTNGKDFLGTIESFIGLDPARAPLEYIEAGISKKAIPVGFMLGLEMGLGQLIALLQPRARRVPAGQQVKMDQDEYRLIFADETLVFNKNDRMATLLLAGFTKFHRSLKLYRFKDFNSSDVYFNVLEEHGLTNRIATNIDTLNKFFIDPITRELLEQMKEPLHFRGLLLRSAEMLVDDHVPEVKDRIRGYERFAGHVYKELMNAVKAHQLKPSRSKQPIDLSPFAVFNSISTDPAKLQVKDINPVEDVKQMDALSFTGTGGRTSRSMNKEARFFTEKEQGLVSEATADSEKVAVNNYTVANPKLNSLRGTYDTFNLEEDGIGHLISTAATLSPYALNDD